MSGNKICVHVLYFIEGFDVEILQAYESISDGLEKSASALVQTPLKKYQRGATAGSALATAVRAVPEAAIAPASACASAIHCALLGLRNRYFTKDLRLCQRSHGSPPSPPFFSFSINLPV